MRDSREQEETICREVPDVAFLEYDSEQHLTFDFLVYTKARQAIRVERKALPDFTASWTDGKLEGQCAAVDLLIIETTVDHLLEDRDPELTRRALLHAGILGANMWVHHTQGPLETVQFLRFLRDRDYGLAVRQNKLSSSAPDTRWRILEALPGVNPYRLMADGRMLGDHLCEKVDWSVILVGLWMGQWSDLPWNGRPIPEANIEKIRTALLGRPLNGTPPPQP